VDQPLGTASTWRGSKAQLSTLSTKQRLTLSAMLTVYLIIGPRQKLYVGVTSQSVSKRLREHKFQARSGVDTYLYNAIRKHGEDHFDAIRIDTASTEEEAYELEKEWIQRLGTYEGRGYNMTKGGYKPPSREGKSHTEEARQKMSESTKVKGKDNPMYGRSHSEETRRKISESSSGESNPQSKLSRGEASEVKWLALNSDLIQKKIGKKYDVPKSTVSRIKNEVRWSDVIPQKP
jgi:group I intron endonuclease